MARMHTRRRGTSGSDRPAADAPPEWSTVEPADIKARVVELAEDGLPPSQIGVVLRDTGVDGVPIPDVTLATEKKITEILADHDAAPDLPEDLENLLRQAVRLADHLDANPTDHGNKRALQNIEAKIRRLVNYYRGDQLPEDFTYTVATARTLLE